MVRENHEEQVAMGTSPEKTQNEQKPSWNEDRKKPREISEDLGRDGGTKDMQEKIGC